MASEEPPGIQALQHLRSALKGKKAPPKDPHGRLEDAKGGYAPQKPAKRSEDERGKMWDRFRRPR